MNKKVISVTFDSNVWEDLVDESRTPRREYADSLKELRSLIKLGRIRPYICDVVLTLESVPRIDRPTYFRSFNVVKQIGNAFDNLIMMNGPFGFAPAIRINMIVSRPKKPPYHPKLRAALQKAFALGFKFIKAPARVAWMRLDEHFYKPIDVSDLPAKLNREAEALSAFESEGTGSAWASDLGRSILEARTDLQHVAPLVAFAYGDSERVQDAVAEWADGDALASHYANQHDVFCTLDQGEGAGADSILHKDRRQWLKDTFGIEIMDPNQLVQFLNRNKNTLTCLVVFSKN